MSCLFASCLKGQAPECQLYDDITETIGKTPIVKINNMAPPGVDLYVKLEYFNPLGSVKDRLALAIIEDGEKRGLLKPGSIVVEATSGNSGIGLSMVCAQRGYTFVAVMVANCSVERRKIMRMLGAKVIVTPVSLGGTGMVHKAEELAEKHGWFLARQFESEANADVHEKTTGPEILEAFKGKRLDYWVTGYGTGGTFAGTGRAIKKARPGVKIVLSEPEEAAMVTSGIKQQRKECGAPAASHDAARPHPIQGLAPNFIALVAEKGLEEKLHDEVKLVGGDAGIRTAMELARKEGIFCGISGGSTVATALEVCRSAPKGSVVLAMVPDTAERYLSTPLFDGVAAEMSEEECKIGQSTATAIHAAA